METLLLSRHNISLNRTVTFNVNFTRIGEIDVMNEKFYAELIVESKWQEIRRIQTYNQEIDWNPELYIMNNINELKESVQYFTQYDGYLTTITERRKVKGIGLV